MLNLQAGAISSAVSNDVVLAAIWATALAGAAAKVILARCGPHATPPTHARMPCTHEDTRSSHAPPRWVRSSAVPQAL
jgi:hypothetical protein